MNTEKKRLRGIKSFMTAAETAEGVRMEVFGNKRACVEGCVGVLEYKKEEITVKTSGAMNICFTGRELRVCCMDKDSLVIEGFILAVSYEV